VGGQTIRMEIAYDGRSFAGFARQPGRRTVEGTLRARLASAVPDVRAFAVGGRTDRGVHAVRQVISFKTRRSVDLTRIGSELAPDDDPDLALLDIRRVRHRFDARLSARGRRYTYFWTDENDFDLLDRLRSLLWPLMGRHDFFVFARDTPKNASTTKRITGVDVRCAHLGEQPALRFDVAAEGFLRRQVRVLVGTAIREARAGAGDDRLLELARTRDRRSSASPAPPEGLHLVKIVY